jgi:Tfp pilus assembly protein PilN
LKHSLGASVVEGHLCLLCLRLGVGRPEVVAALRVALPAGPDEEPAFLEEVAAYLIANRIPAGVRVTLGVPRSQFVLRRFETPKVAARSLPELVGFEMDRHLPGRREDFLCGWRVEGRTAEGGYAVLLGAGRKAALERPLALLRRANLAPSSVQPESFVLAECLRRATHDAGEVLLIDLGPSEAGIDLVRDGRVAFSRTIGIDDPQWREGSGADAAAERREAAQRLGATLAELLGSPLFRESLPGGSLPPLRIGGYGANRSHLVEKLESETRVPVRAFSPWTLVGWASPPADLSPYAAALALALVDGAEGAGLELDPARQEQLHRAPSLRASAVLALLLVGVAVTYLGVFAVRQRAQSALVDREIRVLKTRMVEVEAINRRLQQERAQLEFLRSTISGSARQAEILRELTVLLPDGCYLSEMTYRERKVEIAGFAPSASQLLPAIEASPMFAEVEFSAPIVAQNTGLERFRIRMRLEQPGG